ncbi:hypothetical protein [Chlorobium ferrooxidans]|uniref:hypothetical protein n=1 Tax=Chlorobium ferrooxidans TaxID=84205 RepID=UPI00058D29DA|nr:hypothetical protein [Chlorobium ferrooxidans]
MEQLDIITRIKDIIRNWADIPDSMSITLDQKLNDLRPGAQDELRVAVNIAFSGEKIMPISPSDWNKKKLTTIDSLREFVTSLIK